MKARKKNLNEAERLLIINTYMGGRSAREVSQILNFNRDEVAAVLRNAGVLRKVRKKVEWTDENHIKCSKCDTIKHKDMFPFVTNNTIHKTGYYQSYCKDCRVQQQANSIMDKPISWRSRVARLKNRSEKRKILFDGSVTADYLAGLWEAQQGLCAYTREPMRNIAGRGTHPLAVSIDKIEPNKGYIAGNVVLCSMRANGIKSDQTLSELELWMPLWYKNLMEFKEIWALDADPGAR